MSKKVQIYPVEGFFLVGVATITQQVPAADAEYLVATGAFSYQPPPDAPAEDIPGPADAGPSDSTEA